MIQCVLRWNNERLYKVELENGKSFTVGSGKNDTLFVEELLPGQLKFTYKKGALYASGKKLRDLYTEAIGGSATLQRITDELPLTICWQEAGEAAGQKYTLPYRGVVTIGRKNENNIVLDEGTVSGYQMTLRCEEGMAYVEDGGHNRQSTNGTYLNGHRIQKAKLKSGDIIDLLHLRIEVKNSELIFVDAGRRLHFNTSGVGLGTTQNSRKHLRYRRSPRQRERLPAEPIVLQRPPTKARLFEKRRGFLASLLGSGAMVGASLAMGAASPALIAARAASLVSPVSSVVMGKSDNKRDLKKYQEYEQKRREKYGAYIESQQAVIQQTAEKQREILTRENPAPETCTEGLAELKLSLWERSPKDEDFLQLRVGMGYEPLCVPIKEPMDSSGIQMEDDDVAELAKEIIEENRIVDHVPTRIDLRKYRACGLIGDHRRVVSLLKNLIVAMTYSHFYTEVKLVGIFDEDEKELWQALRWLPHIWDAEEQTRYLAFDEKSANSLSDLFHDLFRGEGKSDSTYYVFLMGSYRMAERLKVVSDILNGGPGVNASILFAYDLGNISADEQLGYLPQQCQFVVNLDFPPEPCCYDVTQTEKKALFTPDPEIKADAFDRYCRTLSAVEVSGGAAHLEIPSAITFLQGMNVNTVEELDAWDRWTQERKNMSTPIGAMAGGKPFYLDVVNDGPHGLVAGTSGSGKSELLTTWLLSLAVNYHPYDVSFVIIDYKGGGLANTLEGLPHMVGKITNIGNNIQRSMVSLHSELLRRQKIFAKCGVSKFSDYSKGFHAGKFREPMPRLLIVADEFRELRSQEPEFMQSLVSAATIGRSLGINLVLATQNPSGIVDDQIRANTNFAICLKVQNASASRDMLGTSDAAHLSQAGRAYVKVGDNDVYEQIQSYWCGAPYLGDRKATASVGNQVRVVELNGERIKTVHEERTRFQSDLDELAAVSKYLTKVANEHHLDKMPCPWLPELPDAIPLDELGVPGAFEGGDWPGALPWLQIPVGRYDRPELQEQGVLCLDLEAEGHYGIYGCAGSGKTMLLKAILCSLGRWYRPKDISIYIIDLGSWSLKTMEQMPHVGGVVLSSEEEKFDKLAYILREEFAKRKKAFSKHGISSLKDYRENVSDDIPAVVLAIDNIQPIFELCPAYEELLTTIAQEGASYGIYLIYTASTQTGIRYKITQNTSGAIAFEMNDDTMYGQLVGGSRASHRLVAGAKGRALIKKTGGPVVFQTALYVPGENEKERVAALKESLEWMDRSWHGARPEPIPVMPESVSVDETSSLYQQRDQLPIGNSTKSFAPVSLDLAASGTVLLTGPSGCGKSRMLQTVAKLLTSREDNELIILDSSRRGLAELEPLGRYVDTQDAELLSRTMRKFIEELVSREAECRDAATDAERQALLTQMPQICVLIDDLKEMTDSEDEAMLRQLLNGIKFAKKLGAVILAAERTEDANAGSAMDPIVSKMTASPNVLLLGGTVQSVTFHICGDLGPEEKIQSLDEGYGYLLGPEQTEKIKLVEA